MNDKVLYQDDLILVINKPSNITVEEVSEQISNIYPELKNLPRHGLINRLDKDTSGIFIIGKNKEIIELLQKDFEERKVKKSYIALVWKQLKKMEGKIETSMTRSKSDRRKHSSYNPEKDGRNSLSFYKVLENFQNYSLIEISPITGRRHQIRSQFAYMGHPLVGENLYRFKDQVDPVEMSRHFLHSHSIEIKLNGRSKKFISELPDDLKEIINKIKCQQN